MGYKEKSDGVGNKITSTFKFTESATTSSIRDFDLNKYLVQFGIVDEEGFTVMGQKIKEIKYADLNNDGKEEAIFTVASGGTSGAFGPFVSTLQNGSLIQLKVDDSNPSLYKSALGSSWGHVLFLSVKNKLIEMFSLYKDSDGNCCPSGGKRYILYSWDGSKFAVQKVIDLGPEWIQDWDESNNEAIKEFGL